MLSRIWPTALLITVIAVSAAPTAYAEPSRWLDKLECGTSERGKGCEISLRFEEKGKGGQDQGEVGDQEAPPPTEEEVAAVEAPPEEEPAPDPVDIEVQRPEDQPPPGGVVVEVVTVTVVVVEEVPPPLEEEPAPPPEEVPESSGTAIDSADSFELPDPKIGTSPGAEASALVRTPLWLWVEEMAPETAEAEVPGLSVSLTATPARTRWSMGDGNEVLCTGPGTPFDPERHDPASESPTCGYVYPRASLGQPGGVYTVTADVVWEVTWESSDGTTGQLEQVETTSQIELAVEESQGLVTDAGST
ncbi:MAG: hypothetical protein M0026_12490 [Nocardiopsaceae bacterium]|nr:hypothetical protein [Nocardiopsaceae bacterium]